MIFGKRNPPTEAYSTDWKVKYALFPVRMSCGRFILWQKYMKRTNYTASCYAGRMSNTQIEPLNSFKGT